MNKQHFHTLLSRYQSGDCTQQEKQLVEQWFSLLDGAESAPSMIENHHLRQKIWNTIKSKSNPDSEHVDIRTRSVFNWRWVAAAVLLLGMIWAAYQLKTGTAKPELAYLAPAGLQSKMNNSPEPVTFSLEDGSQVTLSPGSTVHFPSSFEPGKREVFLLGKAFFSVKKDPQKPFLVYTGQLATKVLGTSFWVDQQADESRVEVAVLTGKVAVFSRDENESDEAKKGVVLTPNQKVNYSLQTRTFQMGLVSQPVMSASYEKAFVFEDAGLDAVFDVIEKAYGIQIVLENQKLKGCLFTADIGKQPLRTKLDLICSSVNAHYEIRGEKIFVSGKGCQ